MGITCADNTTEKYQELYQINIKFKNIKRHGRSCCIESSLSTSLMKIYVFLNIRKLIFILVFILHTTNMVKTCDYLHLDKEIYFAKPLKMKWMKEKE